MNAGPEATNIVLVHGGFVDGSGWQGVYDQLTAAGYRVAVAAAAETFRRLGATPWAARADRELRATGITVATAGTGLAPLALASLTSQQRQIALLAAAGLTNKEIAARLFLSPRTVSTHLYQVFPKLGITSRAALRDALADTP